VNLFHTQQIELIAAYLAGSRTAPLPSDVLDRFTQPWLDYYREVVDMVTEEPNEQSLYLEWFTDFLLQYHHKKDNKLADLGPIREAIKNPRNVAFPSAGQILATLPDYTWLWDGWIPRSLWTLIAAAPGTGKSYFALDLARRCCQGGKFPDDSPVSPSNVLWVDAENRPALFKRRLAIWPPAALDRFYLMLADPELWAINLDGLDQTRFLSMMWELKPTLVVIDSYGSATDKSENTKKDVQRILSFFNQVAIEFDCGLLIIHHLRKPPGGQSSFLPMDLNDVRGSSHLAAMAGVIIGLQWVPTAAEPDPNGARRLWHLKNNIALKPDPMGVLLTPHPADKEVALVQYVDAPEPYKKPTKKITCSDWLLELLAESDKPLRPSEVIQLAAEHKYSRRTVYYAREQLGDKIIDTQDKQHPGNCWSIAP
jgi:hypothetical protein